MGAGLCPHCVLGFYLKPPVFWDWCICPYCEGLEIVDEATGLLFEYESKGVLKDGKNLKVMDRFTTGDKKNRFYYGGS